MSQDALFFLKDFFSSLAAGVNPYLPVEAAAEGEPGAGMGIPRLMVFTRRFMSYNHMINIRFPGAVKWGGRGVLVGQL